MGDLSIRTRSPRKGLLQKCAISEISKCWEGVCPESQSSVTDHAMTLVIWHPMGWNLAELVSPALRTFQLLHGKSELNSLNTYSNHGFNPALPPQSDKEQQLLGELHPGPLRPQGQGSCHCAGNHSWEPSLWCCASPHWMLPARKMAAPASAM